MLTSPTLLATLAIGLAFYLAWNLGANDVANSMGTAVGSRAISLRQALILAGILEFLGTLLFSQAVTGRIATQVANPSQFSDRPQVLLVGMVAVLFTSGIWLQIATLLKVPVSSSQAVVCAIVGFSDVALGPGAVNWQSLGQISLGWLITPLVSGTLAAGFYGLLHQLLLRPKAPLGQEWSDSEMEKGLSLCKSSVAVL
jgi:PiT family inorganic phosphate transporter